MKFVHIADIHFDSPFTTLSDKGTYNYELKQNVNNSYTKCIN